MKAALIMFLSALLILLTGCLDEGIGTLESIICENLDPSSLSPEWDRDHCYKDAALRTKNPDLCKEVKESAPKTKCYMELAVANKQGDLCNNLPNNPSGGDYSRVECLQKVAKATGDPRYCDEMGKNIYSGLTTYIDAYNCYNDLGKNMPIEKIMKLNPGLFNNQEDVMYSLIEGKPPYTSIREDMGLIDMSLREKEYYGYLQGNIEEGRLAPKLELRDGDVIFFGTDEDVSMSKEAAFMGVVDNGKVYLPSVDSESGLDGPYDLDDFFDGQNHIRGTGSFNGISKSYKVYRKE